MAKRSKKKRVQERPSWPSSDWLWGFVLFVAIVVTYSPVWWAGYVWDDDLMVTANPVIVGPLGLTEIWTTKAADICPLTLTTFWLEYKLWGMAPLPYHLANVFLHGACALVLWRVLLGLRIPGAWLGAALWALHPMQVESVAWISEMKNTESGLFYLFSIFFFVRWVRNSGDWNYGLTLVFAALAMAGKSSTVILPVILCLCAWWVEGRWSWRKLAGTVPLFFMSLVAALVSMWTQSLHLERSAETQLVRTWGERLVTAGDAFWFYLGKLVWPYPLMAIYPRWQIDASRWMSYLPLLAMIAVASILWLNRESWSRPWFFVFAYFLVALIPVLGLVNNTFFHFTFVADHFQYLAGMGPLALAGAGVVRLSELDPSRKPWLLPSFGAGVLLILGTVSWQRVGVYESEEKLWTDTLAKNPNCWVGYNDLGRALTQKWQFDEAISDYRRALELNPNYSLAHYNLGTAFSKKGQWDEAIVEYQKALKIDPDGAKAEYNLGYALAQKGNVDDAIAHYQKALKIEPQLVDARNNLGAVLFKQGRVDDAIVQFREALKINPSLEESYNNLGAALLKQGKVDEAIMQFQEAVRLNPQNHNAQNNLLQAEAQQKAGPK